jgi:hypothetical protein
MPENVTALREGFVEAPKTVEQPQPTAPKIEGAPRPAPPPVMENPPPPLVAAEQWPLVVKLFHKAIVNNNGESVTELSFREPRGGDINRYGNPCRINQDGDVVMDERKMHYIMAALCNILPPLLEAMDTRDWNTCAYKLRSFFLPDLRAF